MKACPLLLAVSMASGLLFLSACSRPAARADKAAAPATAALAASLAGELSADEVLDGKYPYPPSPAREVHEESDGFAQERLVPVPPPGQHPRILLSPAELPDLRLRLRTTETGRILMETLHQRLDAAIRKPGGLGTRFYEALAAGDKEQASKILDDCAGKLPELGHYQPWVCALVFESFDAMVADDAARGKKAGTALATYAALIEPILLQAEGAPLGDDVWRAKVAGPVTGSWSSNQGARELIGYHNLGYAYDFAYNFMTDPEREQVRRVIAEATKGKLWMGCRLPHHFRNWNWIAVGLGQPLLALAIEGEEGYDPRVYRMGVDIARDYLTYGISPDGCSTEAVGYTQFGLVWANPFVIAAARRGDNLLVQSHFRRMVDWYLQSMEPDGLSWLSHGDGADRPPSLQTAALWKYYFPRDPKIDFLWQHVVMADGKDQRREKNHMIEALVLAQDPMKDGQAKPVDYRGGAALDLPVTWFDSLRSSLVARNGWGPDEAVVQFECRTDSVGSSHEHADRGSFTFSALGRAWAKVSFRSVESRHHNCVLIDGMGQGMWPGPGRWLELDDRKDLLVASCDLKENYDWWWPKEILTEDPASFARFAYPRWASYRADAEQFRKNYGAGPFVKDPRPSVVAHWSGFEGVAGGPRMWDEDAWPVRLPHNPVQRAFRTIVFSKTDRPWLLVVDDIQKDERERLYEWLMQTGLDTELVSQQGGDLILCDATVPRDKEGVPKPAKGDRLLLVRVLERNGPAAPHDYQATPSIRLETFERKDTLTPEAAKASLSGSRTFGLDKRLVVAARCVAPDFKILLFPYRSGEPMPETAWSPDGKTLTVSCAGRSQTLSLEKDATGRTLVK